MSQTSTIQSRYLFALGANGARGLFLYASGMLLARSLGAQPYGEYAFLLGVMTGLNSLLDLGGNNGFFTFISAHKRSRRFVAAYFLWQFVQMALVLAAIGLVPLQLGAAFWFSSSKPSVAWAFIALFLQYQVWASILAMGDALRRTVLVQSLALVAALAHFALIAHGSQRPGWGVELAFQLLAVSYLAILCPAAFLFWRGLERQGYFAAASSPGWRRALGEYRRFCTPLALQAVVLFACVYGHRWLIQQHLGSTGQAFVAVGQQFGMPALLLASSLVRIIWKEVAEAHGAADMPRVARLLRLALDSLMLVTAFIACYLFVWARELTQLILGGDYEAGALTIGVMVLSVSYQALGQVVSVFYYSTHQNRTFTLVTCLFSGLELALVYLLVAPPSAAVPGLGLGHTAVAVARLAGQALSISCLVTLFGGGTWRLAMRQVFVVGIIFISHLVIKYISAHAVSPRPLQMALSLVATSMMLAVGFAVFFKAELAERFPSLLPKFLRKARVYDHAESR